MNRAIWVAGESGKEIRVRFEPRTGTPALHFSNSSSIEVQWMDHCYRALAADCPTGVSGIESVGGLLRKAFRRDSSKLQDAMEMLTGMSIHWKQVVSDSRSAKRASESLLQVDNLRKVLTSLQGALEPFTRRQLGHTVEIAAESLEKDSRSLSEELDGISERLRASRKSGRPRLKVRAAFAAEVLRELKKCGVPNRRGPLGDQGTFEGIHRQVLREMLTIVGLGPAPNDLDPVIEDARTIPRTFYSRL